MSGYELMQLWIALAVLVVTAIMSHLRGIAWTLVIVADLCLSTEYWRAGLPLADAVTACCDFLVCAAIYFAGRYRWEMWLFLLYQGSMLVSIVDLGAGIVAPGKIDHDLYSSLLEVINYIALLLIGGVSPFVLAGRFDIGAFSPWRRISALVHPLYREDARSRR